MAEPENDRGAKASKPAGRRKWLYRLLAMTLVPALLFGLLEGTLWLCGFGYPTDFFLDGSKVEGAEVWIDNPDFGRWVFPRGLDRTPPPVPFALPKVKAEGTYRVFVLGESAAMGFPDPSSSFARVLEVLLKARHPDRRFEVVNASMVAINSHVVLPISRQCARRQPDLLVVHLGNNEVVGPFGAAGVLGPFSPSRRIIRANLAVKTTRAGQLLDRLVNGLGKGRQAAQQWQGMTMFVHSQVPADDPRLGRIRAHFRENLEAICAAGAGVPVVVCTIPVNLQDCAPFASQHNPELDADQLEAWEKVYQEGVRLEKAKQFAPALARYGQAETLDDRFADLAFRQARCLKALGKSGAARRYFLRARNLDTLRFRADSVINDTIREVATQQGVRLADAERVFAESSPSGVPGEEVFLEHVHMNFRGNYLMARTILDTMPDLGEPAAAPLSEQDCALRLGWTEWNRQKIDSQIYQMLAQQPPFTSQLDVAERGQRWKEALAAMRRRLQAGGMQEAINQYHKALQSAPDDWMIRLNYAQLLSECGALEPAEEQYLEALARLRHCFPAHSRLGSLLLRQGRTDEALYHFREALRLAPDLDEAHFGMADALAAQGKKDEALAIYRERLRKAPNRVSVLVALARFLSRTGNREEAEERFGEALRLEPTNPGHHISLGHLALERGSKDEAIEHYEEALRLQPDLPEVRAHLAGLRKRGKQP